MKLHTLSKIYLALILTFLYVPIAVMILLSFNSSKFYRLPIDWTFKWYELLFENQQLIYASINSILIAFITTILATTIGTCAALAFFRHSFRGKNFLLLLLFPPIAIPWLIIGTSMLVFFFWIGIGRGLFALILGHVALAIPYVIIVVGARLKSFDKALEILKSKQSSGKVLGTDLSTKKEIELKRGRYGFYITDGKINVSLKNGEDATITLEDAIERINIKASKSN